MTKDDEVRRLRKELVFLRARWQRFQHDMQVYRAGNLEIIVNGLASRSFEYHLYLEKRRERCLDRLRELDSSSPAEIRHWEEWVLNWLPRIRQKRQKEQAGIEWNDCSSWKRGDEWTERLVRAGFVVFNEADKSEVSPGGEQWLAERGM